MSVPPKRFRFSVRRLLASITVIAAILALSLQFGPHALWITSRGAHGSNVTPIPSKPLTAPSPNEECVACRVGAYSFELPATMRDKIDIQRAAGGVNLRFRDDRRTLVVNLTPLKDKGLFSAADFPERSHLSYPQLYKEITDADASDFSFTMSHDELRWHKWQLTNRAFLPEMESLEYNFDSDLNGNLLSFSPTCKVYDWGTSDGKWKGTMHFHGADRGSAWVRHTCATFAIIADPSVFLGANDAAIRSMIHFSALEDSVVQ